MERVKENIMSIVVDQKTEAVTNQRRARGKGAVIDLHVTPIAGGGYTLAVDWREGADTNGRVVMRQGNVVLTADRRIAAYARWHDVAVSVQRLGPLRTLVLKDPITLFRIGEWERSHPGLARRAG
jgi:hypothetical protein